MLTVEEGIDIVKAYIGYEYHEAEPSYINNSDDEEL